MKLATCCLLGLAALAACRTVADEQHLFNDFKSVFNRQYAEHEESTRLACFRRNLQLIDEKNARGHEVHGVNQFADLCQEEFAQRFLGFRHSNATALKHRRSTFMGTPNAAPSPTADWRNKGAVTPVKNQGQCGSCWSFSATGNMEGQWFLAGNSLTGLSEEELVQCSKNGGDAGCQGGLMDNAFDWVVTNGGIAAESVYPYKSGDGITGTCNNALLKNYAAHVTGHTDIAKNENTMEEFVSTSGPLSIGVDALSWQFYLGGIMRYCLGKQLDHGVLIVGYDTTHTPPYWIIKNSWGATWGENGYIRVAKGHNECGLTQAASTSIAQKN
jgi:cathepsin F/cysteine peptidase B